MKFSPLLQVRRSLLYFSGLGILRNLSERALLKIASTLQQKGAPYSRKYGGENARSVKSLHAWQRLSDIAYPRWGVIAHLVLRLSEFGVVNNRTSPRIHEDKDIVSANPHNDEERQRLEE